MLVAIDAENLFDAQIEFEKILFCYLAKGALALCHFWAGRYREAALYYRLAGAVLVADCRLIYSTETIWFAPL